LILFLDTSALAKLYIAEPGSEAMRRRISNELIAVSQLAYAEAHATFARRRREDLLTADESPVPEVETLARALLDRGIRPGFDTWKLVPGGPWQTEATVSTSSGGFPLGEPQTTDRFPRAHGPGRARCVCSLASRFPAG